MSFDSCVTTEQILWVFTDEVQGKGGRVSDTCHDGTRLFTRAIFPKVKNVASGDGVQGGIALKAAEVGVCIYPYLFRQVCSNGAIIANGVGVQAIVELRDRAPEIALQEIREKVGVFSSPEVFQSNVTNMRESRRLGFDHSLAMLPNLAKLPKEASAWLSYEIMKEFFAAKDQSPFALGNMITAVARDTKDPEIRWNLEELGGRILCQSYSPRPSEKKAVDLDRLRKELSMRDRLIEESWLEASHSVR